MQKEEITSAGLLTVAMTLLTMGINFLNNGNIVPGIACIVVGATLIFSAVILIERGIIAKMNFIIEGLGRRK